MYKKTDCFVGLMRLFMLMLFFTIAAPFFSELVRVGKSLNKSNNYIDNSSEMNVTKSASTKEKLAVQEDSSNRKYWIVTTEKVSTK